MRIAYICDLCGERFDLANECLEHEKNNHVKPLEIIDYCSYGLSYYFPKYPGRLTLKMSNGDTAVYLLDDRLTIFNKELKDLKVKYDG